MHDYIDIRPVWDDPVILGVKEEYWNIDHLKTTIFGEEEKDIFGNGAWVYLDPLVRDEPKVIFP